MQAHGAVRLADLFDGRCPTRSPLASATSVRWLHRRAGADSEVVCAALEDGRLWNASTVCGGGSAEPTGAGAAAVEAAAADRSRPVSLIVSRRRFGSGLWYGGIATEVRNTGSHRIAVDYLDVIPWRIVPLLPTLRMVPAGGLRPDGVHVAYRHIRPGRYRRESTLIELSLLLAPNASVRIAFRYEMAFLHVDEYPAEADRGVDVGCAVAMPAAPIVCHGAHLTRRSPALVVAADGSGSAFSDALVVPCATPDFTMRYNAVSLACTVLAVAFGMLFNVAVDDDADRAPAGHRPRR